MTIEELKEKYSNIEDKIPSVWQTYQEAGLELRNDIHNGICDVELIRVISLISLQSNVILTSYINPIFSFAGLYPQKMKVYDIKPEINVNGKFITIDKNL